jgi:hypothetical protein
MTLSLSFDASHQCALADGIEIPTELRVGDQIVEFMATLDTGAAHCIFERRYAEELGLDVEAGRSQRFRTVAGSFVAFQHEVTIRTLGIEFSAVVFFAEDETFTRNFLARPGWLDRVRVGIVDYARRLFLAPYGS